ncbi:MAG: hypothetical protein U5K79_17140 [Cyclobacteriaceae bacterium]|nr:hypothetical protein [Cyclobacteriaceae bacterium]
MIRTAILFCLLLSALTLQAQEYKNSAGFRFCKTDGLTYKRFLTTNGAIETMLGFGGYDGGMQAYVNYQWYQPVPSTYTGYLHFYYGVGGHTGYIRPTRTVDYYEGDQIVSETQQYTDYVIGVDGILGVEYRIFTVPMTVGMDIKPFFEYYALQYTRFRFWDFGFTVKYIF